MKIAILLAAMSIAMFFVIGLVANSYGPNVGGRFLERGGKYTEVELTQFVVNSPIEARGYLFPVLFPLDLLFIIFLGGFLGFGSVDAAESIAALRKVAWLFAIAPSLYVAADLIEDTLLARMLLHADAISQDAIWVAQKITIAKFVACTFGISQTIILSGVAAYR